MSPTTTPFLVLGAAMAADLPTTVANGVDYAPNPGEDFTHWAARTVIMLAFAFVWDEWRYRRHAERANKEGK